MNDIKLTQEWADKLGGEAIDNAGKRSTNWFSVGGVAPQLPDFVRFPNGYEVPLDFLESARRANLSFANIVAELIADQQYRIETGEQHVRYDGEPGNNRLSDPLTYIVVPAPKPAPEPAKHTSDKPVKHTHAPHKKQ